jgi:type IV pilus assembly protein PilN
MRVIEELQSNRPAIVHLFDELAKIIPEGLYIDSLEQKSGSITITGQAQSNARVSAFMRALEESKWFKKPSLEIISSKAAGSRKEREFTLRVTQDAPTSQGSQDGGEK